MEATTSGMEPSEATESPRLFTRNATGLVRELSGFQQVIWNWIAGAPMLGLAFGVFFGLSGFPGGNLFLGILLALPLALATCYAFGLLTTAMPRSGGDYTLVSRTIHPAIGLAGSFCMVLTQGLGIALVGGLLFTTLGVAPSLLTLGLVSGNTTFIDWGTTVATDKDWQFAIGAVAIVLGGALVATGWRASKRLMFGLLAFSLFGLAVAALIALFTSQSEFASSIDDFAASITGKGGTYDQTIATATEAGIDPDPPFSFSNSLPLIAVFASFGIYAYLTTYIGGEIREGSSIKAAHRMAAGALLGLGSIALLIAIFFGSWGREFITAGYAGGFPPELGGLPSYFTLTSLQIDNTVFTVFQCLAFLAFPLVLIAYLIVTVSRIFFAWSFDGLLPAQIAKVARNNAPVVATVLATVLSLALWVWAIYIADSLIQVVAYTALIQLVPIGLVGIAAVIVPYVKKQLYRATATNRTFIGLPLMVIAGVGAIVTVAVNFVIYFSEEYFALGDRMDFFLWLFGTIGAGLVWYFVARLIRRNQGVDLDLVYREIPPE
jgi:APA family basic amino acid/polyamine antiporter